MTRRGSLNSGFTLLELLVVLAIIGVVLGTTALARPNAAGARLNAAARGLVATLRLAHAQAMERNVETVVSLDAGAGVIRYAQGQWQLPAGVHVALTFAEAEARGTAGGLRFYPDGQSSGGEIRLALDNRRARVSVGWLTGEARVEP